ncbi:uncharacterized protein LOC130080431 [Rhinichthys klamathensis goyatoka]|uniref:uncharacterized protein LOC130080431 n=1 Tax=Rhinichthys klamathensis goyatoka TaxID=3034132 RepID=UPI0024B5A5E0|nr:uncharacterized protein LOC130080431 [Rhinichthys klamathensis goyatoka]
MGSHAFNRNVAEWMKPMKVTHPQQMAVLLVTLLAALLCPSVHSADSAVAWCYHKPTCNFATWPQIAPQSCSGSRQSPIDIKTRIVKGNANLTSFNFTGFDDNSTFMSIANSGDSVVVNLDDDKMTVQGGDLPGLYNTKQFHLHWGNGSSSPGSEHTVDGKQYPMELHIVNVHSKYNGSLAAALAAKDSTGLAVLGFFIEGTNEQNKTKSWDILTSFLKQIPSSGDTTVDIMNQITMDSLLEGVNMTEYYRYQGSLTTPNCNEVVIWTVFKDPIKVSQDLINRFSTTTFFKASPPVLTTNNFRGVQPLNGRVVTSQRSTAPSSAATSTISIITVLLLSRLCWLSGLDDERIKACYRLGANAVDPRELPDLSGLDWRKALSTCLESFIPWHAVSQPDLQAIKPAIRSVYGRQVLMSSQADPLLKAARATKKTAQGPEPRPAETAQGPEPRPAETAQGPEPRPAETAQGPEPRPAKTAQGPEPRPAETAQGPEPRPAETAQGPEPRPAETAQGPEPRPAETAQGPEPRPAETAQGPEPRPAETAQGPEPRPAETAQGPEPRPAETAQGPEPRPAETAQGPEPRPAETAQGPEPRPAETAQGPEPRPAETAQGPEPRPAETAQGPEPRPPETAQGPEPRPAETAQGPEPSPLVPSSTEPLMKQRLFTSCLPSLFQSMSQSLPQSLRSQSRNGGLCQCGSTRDTHPSVALGDNFSTAMVSHWDSTQHSSVQPTDAYGELEFAGAGKRHSYTKEMIVDFRKKAVRYLPLSINDQVVERVPSFCFLGTTIHQSLSWDLNISLIVNKAHQRLYFLRQLRKFGVSQEGMTHFYRAVIESVLTFSILSWYGNSTSQDKQQLEKVVLRASKITGCRKRSCIGAMGHFGMQQQTRRRLSPTSEVTGDLNLGIAIRNCNFKQGRSLDLSEGYNCYLCNYVTTWPKSAPQSCNGSIQSPIDINTTSVLENANLTSFNFTGFDDNSTLMSMVNTGDSVVVTLTNAKMTVQGGDLPGVYNSTQLTFHWGNGSSSNGSEHTVNGKQYPMELQILNIHSKYNGNLTAALAANDSTGLAVLSFFIEVSKTTFIISKGKRNTTSAIMPLDSLLEGVNRTKYYRYRGSLTTPNCNEVVIWTVFKDPIKVSQDLINRFSTTTFFKASPPVLMTNNFRGVQPLNGRVVTSQRSTAPSSAATSTISIITVLLLSRLF